MSTGLDVFGIGNALVDIQVRVDDAFIQRFGLQRGRMELVDAGRQGELLAELEGHTQNRCSGGSAANTVVGVAALGGGAAYLGKVGRDKLGASYRDDLRSVGVRFDVPGVPGPTGTSLVLITPDAQRTMLTSLGVTTLLDASDVKPSTFLGAAYVYVEGYLLMGEATRRAALAAVAAAKGVGARVALTVSDPVVVQVAGDVLRELIRGPVDLLFCNEIEAEALTGTADPVAGAHALHDMATSVALTLGSKGSLLMHDGTLHPIEAVKVDAVDLTGAGDMYAAGLLYGLTNRMSWPEAGRLASLAAARVVSTLGARLPTKVTKGDALEVSRSR